MAKINSLLVDARVKGLSDRGALDIDAEVKRHLVETLYIDRKSETGSTPLIGCINRLATSLAQVFLGERKSVELPAPTNPLAGRSSTTSDEEAGAQPC